MAETPFNINSNHNIDGIVPRITNCKIHMGEQEIYAAHSFEGDVCFDKSVLNMNQRSFGKDIEFSFRTFRFTGGNQTSDDQEQTISCELHLEPAAEVTQDQANDCTCYDKDDCTGTSGNYEEILKIAGEQHVGHPVSILARNLTIPKYFRLRFEIMFGPRDTSGWANIFRISDGTDPSRWPAIFMNPGSTTSNHACHFINGSTNYCFDFHQSDFVGTPAANFADPGLWHTVEIKQVPQVSGDAIYSIEYNGHEVFSIENNDAIEKPDMELSLGDTYYLNANSKARNIILEEVLDA